MGQICWRDHFTRLRERLSGRGSPIEEDFALLLFAKDRWPGPFFSPHSTEEEAEAPLPPQGPELLFVSEKPSDWQDDIKQGQARDDILSKMMAALKRNRDQIGVEFIKSGSVEESSRISEYVADLKPQVVVTLGAVATNMLLGRKERLSKVHGTFFDHSVPAAGGGRFNFRIFPLFHPDILRINTNMKRSAWIDMQKLIGQ